jgi:hypothetical protein
MPTPAETFQQAAALVSNDPKRKGNLLQMGAPTQVVISGDIHGYQPNMTALLNRLDQQPDMVLILQEIIHGPVDPATGIDGSPRLLLQAAEAKLKHPERLFFLLGNHDIAQVTRKEITKNGRGVCADYMSALTAIYADQAPDVYMASMTFLRSLPLAARFDNGVFAAHSMPSPHRVAMGSSEILDRPSTIADMERGQPTYEWTWGRDQSEAQFAELAQERDVNYFVLGHRHIGDGVLALAPNAIAICTDRSNGKVFRFNATHPVTPECVQDHLFSVRE